MPGFRGLCLALCILCVSCEEVLLPPDYPETRPDRPTLAYGWIAVEGHIEILEEHFSGPVSLTCPSGKRTTTAQAGLYSFLFKVE